MPGPFWISQCHGAVCSDFCDLGWVVIDCLETQMHGLASPGCRGSATYVSIGPLGIRSTWCLSALHCRIYVTSAPIFFDGAQTDAMVLFMWQDDMIGVVRFIDECLERILYTSDQP